MGYILFTGIAVLIARKLGLFEAVQEFWNNSMGSLPFNQIKEMQIDPELLKQFQGQGSLGLFTSIPSIFSIFFICALIILYRVSAI